jgi:F420H(2)-dependent quinone reductase
LTGGRRGLAAPSPGGKFGYLRLKTIGRHSGKERAAILGYYEDGPNLITLAMNGWAEAEPAWWLNLQAHPDASVELKNGSRDVRARAAKGEERDRLWAKVRDYSGYGSDVDGYAKLRSSETAVVILEPRADSDD